MELGPMWEALGLPGLFLASFVAATVLPFSSEAVLAAMARGPWDTGALWAAASLGNWLGGMSSYGLGRLGDLPRLARWTGADPGKALAWRERVRPRGVWMALLCWLPVVGDPIAIALGLLRSDPWATALLMFVGKAARYGVLLVVMRALV
ncbi:MAG: DedA family protein [Flavobacteriales bacterium]|nr:DedA family protein [Flavobacteriales bacterium]NUQ14118.1 DedA family protein [Flavobacteriales bacterium]